MVQTDEDTDRTEYIRGGVMVIRDYDGTLDGLYDIVWEMSLRVKEIDERLQTVEGELLKDKQEETEN